MGFCWQRSGATASNVSLEADEGLGAARPTEAAEGRSKQIEAVIRLGIPGAVTLE